MEQTEKAKRHRKNSSLTMRLLPALRAQLEAWARESGRSLAEEATHRIALSSVIGSELQDIHELKQVTEESLKALLVRRGWGKVIDPRYGGAVFVPPGQHALPQSGFIDVEEVAEAVAKALAKRV
jgi:hypothetical protein